VLPEPVDATDPPARGSVVFTSRTAAVLDGVGAGDVAEERIGDGEEGGEGDFSLPTPADEDAELVGEGPPPLECSAPPPAEHPATDNVNKSVAAPSDTARMPRTVADRSVRTASLTCHARDHAT
jgi:hypothetical protein